MTSWVNHVTIAAPRNGTATHTASPATGTVVTGAFFTPTAGRLLVCVSEGPVTSTTPSGWTLPTNGSAVNNTGLYVWWKVAAGSDTLTTTHNGSNYPLVYDFYEFASGTTFLLAASSGTSSGSNVTLDGLTGTNWLAAAAGQDNSSAAAAALTWTEGTQVVNTSTVASGTDGYTYGLTYIQDSTATTATFDVTASVPANGNPERIAFAVQPADPLAGAATVTAVAATGSGLARPPAIGGNFGANVAAVKASATALAVNPLITIDQVTTGGGPATATALARPPAVAGSTAVNGTVTAVIATATSLARPPAVTGTSIVNGTVTAVRAAATAQARRPFVSTNVTLATGPQFVAPDGSQAVLLGWWDGTAIQPVTIAGYWDGAGKHALS